MATNDGNPRDRRGIFLQRQPLVGVDLVEQERRRKLNNLGLAQRAAWQERNDAAKRLYEVVARHRMTKLVAGFEVKVKVSYSKNEITVTGYDPEEEMAQMAQAVEAKRQRLLDSEKPAKNWWDDIRTLPLEAPTPYGLKVLKKSEPAPKPSSKTSKPAFKPSTQVASFRWAKTSSI